MAHDRIPRKGKTARQIAKRTGLSIRTIQAWTSEPREVYEQTAHDRRTKIVELHRDQGLGVRAIARELNVSPGLVSIRLREAREAGVLAPTRGCPTK